MTRWENLLSSVYITIPRILVAFPFIYFVAIRTFISDLRGARILGNAFSKSEWRYAVKSGRQALREYIEGPVRHTVLRLNIRYEGQGDHDIASHMMEWWWVFCLGEGNQSSVLCPL